MKHLVLCQGARLMGVVVPGSCTHLCDTVPRSVLQLIPLLHGPSSMLEHKAQRGDAPHHAAVLGSA